MMLKPEFGFSKSLSTTRVCRLLILISSSCKLTGLYQKQSILRAPFTEPLVVFLSSRSAAEALMWLRVGEQVLTCTADSLVFRNSKLAKYTSSTQPPVLCTHKPALHTVKHVCAISRNLQGWKMKPKMALLPMPAASMERGSHKSRKNNTIHESDKFICMSLSEMSIWSSAARSQLWLQTGHISHLWHVYIKWIIHERLVRKCCGEMKPKSGYLASTRRTMFGGSELLRIQDDFTPPRGQWVELQYVL